MTEALDLLRAGGVGLADKIVYAETWRGKAEKPQEGPIKFYLPAHQRFYLIAASLVRKSIGYPDHPVNAQSQETARFIIRKVQPSKKDASVDIRNTATYEEFAWSTGQAAWVLVTERYNVDAGEETFPLHSYAAGEQCGRTFLMGYIPLAVREGTVTPSEETPSPQGLDNRCILWRVQVVQPLIDLYNQASVDTGNSNADTLREVVLFALVDCIAFFQEHIEDLLTAVTSNDPNNLDTDTKAFYQLLANAAFYQEYSWQEAIAKVVPLSDAIIDGTVTIATTFVNGMTSSQIKTAIAQIGIGATTVIEQLDFYTKLCDALPGQDSSAHSPSETEPSMATQDSLYIIRCLYDHPLCRDPLKPEKRLHPPLVSEPTDPFKIAFYFDADAPQRSVKICMPIDTSIAGLRKLPRNVKVMISEQLMNQMERIKNIKIKDMEDGTIGSEGTFNIGMICSFSIHITFIIALMLLFMFAIILNLIFWWMPFFKICLPIPLKKSKG